MGIESNKMKVDVNFAEKNGVGRIHIETKDFSVKLRQLKNDVLVGTENVSEKDIDYSSEILLNFDRQESIDLLIKCLEVARENLRSRDSYNQYAYCC